MINLREFMMTCQFQEEDRYLPSETEVRKFIFELASQAGVFKDNFNGPLFNSIMKPSHLISNVNDLRARHEYAGVDIYIYQTANPGYCKVGYSEDHISRSKAGIKGLASKEREKRDIHYHQYLWHKRFQNRAHAILIEEALMRPQNSGTKPQPICKEECKKAGIPWSTEIFRIEDIDKIRRKIEISYEKIILHPDHELEFAKNNIKAFNAEARLILYARQKHRYASNVIYLREENRVKIFTRYDQENALGKGHELMFINWKKWSEYCNQSTSTSTSSRIKSRTKKKWQTMNQNNRRIIIYAVTSNSNVSDHGKQREGEHLPVRNAIREKLEVLPAPPTSLPRFPLLEQISRFLNKASGKNHLRRNKKVS